MSPTRLLNVIAASIMCLFIASAAFYMRQMNDIRTSFVLASIGMVIVMIGCAIDTIESVVEELKKRNSANRNNP